MNNTKKAHVINTVGIVLGKLIALKARNNIQSVNLENALAAIQAFSDEINEMVTDDLRMTAGGVLEFAKVAIEPGHNDTEIFSTAMYQPYLVWCWKNKLNVAGLQKFSLLLNDTIFELYGIKGCGIATSFKYSGLRLKDEFKVKANVPQIKSDVKGDKICL